VSYTHHTEADFAASELARMFASDPSLCYASDTSPAAVSASASYEGSSSGWPLADGVVSLLEPGGTNRFVAVEYKRPEEGLHGLLTAMGQAHAYLHKGYNAAAIVVPALYRSHARPAEYVSDVLSQFDEPRAIGVFKYDPPDTSSPTPFAGRLHCVRPLEVLTSPRPTAHQVAARVRTQWVHMREGSTTRAAFFRFLQVAKLLSADPDASPRPLRKELVAAVARVAPGRDAHQYIANTADDKFLTRVWRLFWFEWVATESVLTPWIRIGKRYETPKAFTRIEKDDGTGLSQIFEGRADGLKETLVDLLNRRIIKEREAWEHFVSGFARPGRQSKQGVRDRAHSYREDLDSSLAKLQWIGVDGRPTDYGYRYMTLCERYGGPNSPAAIEYVGASLLQTGGYGSFLHYVHRLSERRFSQNPLAFAEFPQKGRPIFTENSYTDYLSYLEDAMADELRVVRKVSGRARPRRRTTFQAELTLLRNYGFVSRTRHRLGVGIPIHWEHVLEATNVEL
jgi:hypothetical protein